MGNEFKHYSHGKRSFSEDYKQLDQEWVVLIKQALQAGIPKEDILMFIRKNSNCQDKELYDACYPMLNVK